MTPQIITAAAKLQGVSVLDSVRIVMRKGFYSLMYDIARHHRDQAAQVDGKDINQEIQHSMISILFCHTCLEAFINAIAKDRTQLEFTKKHSTYDKWMAVSKCLATEKHAQKSSVFNSRTQPCRSFKELTEIRHDLVHWKAEFAQPTKTKYGNTERTIQTFNASKADWACKTVRNMITKLLENMNEPPEVPWLD